MEHQLELLPRDLNSFLVSRIDHEDDRVGVLVVASPVGTQACLAAEVPDLEFEVFVGHGLHIEAHSYRQVYQLAIKIGGGGFHKEERLTGYGGHDLIQV